MRKIELNLKQEQLSELVMGNLEHDTAPVMALTVTAENGEPFELLLFSNEDEEDTTFTQDEIDEIMDDLEDEVCPECNCEGVVDVPYEDSKGRDMEKQVPCKNEWHDE